MFLNSLPDLIPLFFLFIAKLSAQNINLKKCCPITSRLTTEPYLECAPSVPETDRLFWVPTGRMLNESTLRELAGEEIKRAEQRILESGFSINGSEDCIKHDGYEAFYKDQFDEEFRIVVSEKEASVFVGQKLALVNIKDDKITPWLIPASDVCFDVVYDEDSKNFIYVVMHCSRKNVPWIRKCCPITSQHIYNVSSKSCQPMPNSEYLTDWRPQDRQISGQARFYIKADSTPKCENTPIVLLKSTENEWKCRGFLKSSKEATFLPNGTLQINNSFTYDPQQYCGERTWHDGNKIIQENYIICGRTDEKTATTLTHGALFLVGGVCLLLTVALSLWLPELRRTMHSRLALTHNATLMVAYFVWGASQLVSNATSAQCTIMSLLIQFTFLGSFVWLNAMCVDISSTFRKTMHASRGSWKRYMIYSAYAWSATVAISILTVIFEFIEEPPFGIPRPGITCFCGFPRHHLSIFLYFYGPMVVALLLNFVLYIFTTWEIWKLTLDAKKVLKDSNITGRRFSPNDKQLLIVYTKLFLLMGLTWIMEVIGWAVDGDNAFWFIMEIINLLRAVFIFIIFICKKPILRNIQSRLKSIISAENSENTSSMEPSTRQTSSTVSGDTIRSKNPKTNSEVNETCATILIK